MTKTQDGRLPIIFGIEGTKLTQAEIDLFVKFPVYGFILFARNIDNKDQVLELNTSLKSLYPEHDVPIFVDQEGGRVARIKPPLADELYPTAEQLAEGYVEDPEAISMRVEENYAKIMKEAKVLGFDSLCSPVCDLRFKETSDVIGDRSFGQHVKQVVALCEAAIKGIVGAGGIPFIKHIPGHGRATVDSHFELPIVKTTLKELEETDFAVFRQLAASEYKNKIWGMTAHIVFEALDSSTPATLSKKAMDYIRSNIFDGVVVSDDIGMLALHGEVGKNRETAPEAFAKSLADVSVKSLEAGCDYVLHCSGVYDEMLAVAGAVEGATKEEII